MVRSDDPFRADFELHPRQMQAEPLPPVVPGFFQSESRSAEHGFYHLLGVFVAVLGVNTLARVEADGQIWDSQTDFLWARALEVDFHSRL